MINRRLKQAAALGAVALRHPGVAGDIGAALLRGRFGAARRMAYTVTKPPATPVVVSPEYRYLWIRNPKVASESILTLLRGTDPSAERFVNKSAADVYARRPEARTYYSFAFVRHPFDRALSFYADVFLSPETYTREQRLHRRERSRVFFRGCYGLEEAGSFDGYCQWLNTPYGSDAFADRHFKSQHLQLGLADGRLPDFIGRFENLDADWKQVAVRLGLSATTLPKLNTTAGWQPPSPEALQAARAERAAQLTEQNRALLRMRYADDLKLFGYSPTGAA